MVNRITTLEDLQKAADSGEYVLPESEHKTLFPNGIGQIDETGKFVPAPEFAAYCRGIALATKAVPSSVLKCWPMHKIPVHAIRWVRPKRNEFVYWTNSSEVVFFDLWGDCTRAVGTKSTGWRSEDWCEKEYPISDFGILCRNEPIKDFGAKLHFQPVIH